MEVIHILLGLCSSAIVLCISIICARDYQSAMRELDNAQNRKQENNDLF